MKISIITVVYNNEATIRNAIDSVLSQDYPDIEYIVIDGASKDKTFDIIQSYGDKITKVVSEPDKGIYDAMNKGVKLATGDVVGILNSDDLYASDTIISDVMELIQKEGTDCLYGDLIYVRQDDITKKVRYWKSGKQKDFKSGWHPPHPSFFVKKSVYDECGLYDTALRVSADFEMMLRILDKHKCRVSYLPKVIVKMRVGGESNRSLKNIIQGYHDMKQAFEINGIRRSVFYPLFRYLPKIKEFVS